MAKVIIVGAGGVGQVVAHKCAQVPDVFSEIVLASRNEAKCRHIASQIARPIATAQVDADNVAEMTALIRREKPDLVINVALPYQDLPIMDACLETGVDYLDTANYASAVEIAALPQSIRGFGHVKNKSRAEHARKQDELLARYRREPSIAQAAD